MREYNPRPIVGEKLVVAVGDDYTGLWDNVTDDGVPTGSLVEDIKNIKTAVEGMTATAQVSNTTGTPAATVTKTKVNGVYNLGFSFSGIKGSDANVTSSNIKPNESGVTGGGIGVTIGGNYVLCFANALQANETFGWASSKFNGIRYFSSSMITTSSKGYAGGTPYTQYDSSLNDMTSGNIVINHYNSKLMGVGTTFNVYVLYGD